ncbi:MAG: hypothetical protein ACREO1_09805 [Arenimonas sp.]
MRILNLCILLLSLFLAGCNKSQSVVSGPVSVGTEPTEVRFLKPIQVRGDTRNVILVFQHSFESDLAELAHVTFVTANGRDEIVLNRSLSRGGEAIIGFSIQVPVSSPDKIVTLRGIKISSKTPFTLRDIWWPEQQSK